MNRSANSKNADFAMKEKHLELRSQLNRLNLEMEKVFGKNDR
jgi:hypothetical protein